MRYQRQFGDTATFAIRVGLIDDPAPPTHPDPGLQASFGHFEIWARGRCLTRNTSSDGTSSDGITWYLWPLIEWLGENLAAIVNEEPFPEPLDEIPSACSWFLASEEPPITLLQTEEDRWFGRRDAWRRRHSLRAAFDGAAHLPAVFFRRLGAHLEISWDNITFPGSRLDIVFGETRGFALLPLQACAETLVLAHDEVRDTIEVLGPGARERLGEIKRAPDDWKLLLPRGLGEQVACDPEFRELVEGLEQAKRPGGVAVSHTLETWLLRSAPSAESVAPVLQLADRVRRRKETLGQALAALRRPSPAPSSEPWREGYERALELREAMNLDGEPLPALDAWLRDQGVGVEEQPLGPAIDAALAVTSAGSVLLDVAPRGQGPRLWSRQMSFATGLGHLLLDAPIGCGYGVFESPWASWPSAARARAFGAMFLMPERGVLETLGNKSVDAEAVGRIASCFGTSVVATTWHLKNLRLITEDHRLALLTDPVPG